MHSAIAIVIVLVIFVVEIAALWRVFTKAGEAGWQAIIPIWNTVVLLKIVGRPIWWFILLLIPLLNIIFFIVLAIDLAKSFGKGGGFAVGLIFLGVIFYPILGFGSARYAGPAAGGRAINA